MKPGFKRIAALLLAAVVLGVLSAVADRVLGARWSEYVNYVMGILTGWLMFSPFWNQRREEIPNAKTIYKEPA